MLGKVAFFSILFAALAGCADDPEDEKLIATSNQLLMVDCDVAFFGNSAVPNGGDKISGWPNERINPIQEAMIVSLYSCGKISIGNRTSDSPLILLTRVNQDAPEECTKNARFGEETLQAILTTDALLATELSRVLDYEVRVPAELEARVDPSIGSFVSWTLAGGSGYLEETPSPGTPYQGQTGSDIYWETSTGLGHLAIRVAGSDFTPQLQLATGEISEPSTMTDPRGPWLSRVDYVTDASAQTALEFFSSTLCEENL